MSDTQGFDGRVGLETDFFEPCKIAHVAVEAPIEKASSALVNAESFFSLKGGGRLRLEQDILGKPCREEWPQAIIFQLQGLRWTQIAIDIRKVKGLPLGKFLSGELETRCVCIEVTDDAYQSHALFDNGMTKELYLLSMNIDMNRALSALDVDVSAEFKELGPDDYDQMDEAEYSYSSEGSPTDDPADLVTRVGCYLLTPVFGETVHRVSDLQSKDLVRMDVVWLDHP
jgi:hypothetical protein